ncbi:MAG: MFS transporter, partial [Actinobacteria bacterium]|nr:MFS transporter [Actinomycetota bacterium]
MAGLVCRLPAGALADHFDRRRVMILADVVRAVALGSIAIAAAFGVLSVWQVVVTALVDKSFGEPFRPASTAALRRVVRPEEMPAAVSRLEARSYAAGAAGPPLGGLLFGLATLAPFAADAVSYVYSLVSTFFVRTSMAVAPSPAPERIVTRLAGGLRWIWSERLIRDILVSAAGINAVFGAPGLAVIVDTRDHGATSTEIGVMLGIAGAAGFVGATLATRLAKSAHPSLVVLGIFWVTAALIPLIAIDANPCILGAATLLAPAANTKSADEIFASMQK